MEFRLFYAGPLPAKSRGVNEIKHDIRLVFSRQLYTLWHQPPLSEQIDFQGHPGIVERYYRPPIWFRPLVCDETGMVAELDVLVLRPEEAGAILEHGGDIDNRLKNLLDALRVPMEKEVQSLGPKPAVEGGDGRVYTLLGDDRLVTRVSITTDQLLEPQPAGIGPAVVAVIHVQTRNIRGLPLSRYNPDELKRRQEMARRMIHRRPAEGQP